MGAFWSSVALISGWYHGQPMAVHLSLPIDTPHLGRWLEIFAAAASHVCPAPAAAHFLERGHRIADSLELGVAFKGRDRAETNSSCLRLSAGANWLRPRVGHLADGRVCKCIKAIWIRTA
jgi:hypothetical protein